tara:strand:- start:2688 stop:3206 length:519 start_codon:yes stop_codon:yes gene_type:complete
MKFDKIFLLGFMGCGKSTFGKKLAEQIGWNYIDLDNYIEKKEGKSIPTIFKENGETYFRNLETKFLKELTSLHSCVISCGGGTPCYNHNMDIILKKGASVYMKVAPHILHERLKLEKTKRPLIAGMTDSQMFTFIQNKLNERANYYKLSEFTFENELESEETFINRINDFII